MPLNFDAETVGKIYTPVAVAIGAMWGWYKRREKTREKVAKADRDQAQKDREIHQARIDATILKCELERKEDRKECREQYAELQARLDSVQDHHNKTVAEAFTRVADALDIMVKRKRASDQDSDVHPSVKPKDHHR